MLRLARSTTARRGMSRRRPILPKDSSPRSISTYSMGTDRRRKPAASFTVIIPSSARPPPCPAPGAAATSCFVTLSPFYLRCLKVERLLNSMGTHRAKARFVEVSEGHHGTTTARAGRGRHLPAEGWPLGCVPQLGVRPERQAAAADRLRPDEGGSSGAAAEAPDGQRPRPPARRQQVHRRRLPDALAGEHAPAKGAADHLHAERDEGEASSRPPPRPGEARQTHAAARRAPVLRNGESRGLAPGTPE